MARKIIVEHRYITPESGTGIGLGSIIAALLSWTVNHSIVWSVIHGILNWAYVVYWVLFKW